MEIPTCRRCGAAFSVVATRPTALPQTPRPTEVSRFAPPAPLRKKRDATGIILGIGAILLIAIVTFGVRAIHRASDFHSDMTVGRSFPGLPSVPQNGRPGGSDLTGSMFMERPGNSEMPTVFVENMAMGTLHLELRDKNGRVYQVSCNVNQRVPLQVPAGNYLVHVSSNVPNIIATDGDATFRRFKEYDAPFSIGPPSGPMHLGD